MNHRVNQKFVEKITAAFYVLSLELHDLVCWDNSLYNAIDVGTGYTMSTATKLGMCYGVPVFVISMLSTK